MKKVFKTILLTAVIATTVLSTKAQDNAFEKGNTLVTLGIGGSSMFHIPANYSYGYGYSGLYNPATGLLSVQAEWGIHKYVGLGLTAGFGGGTGYAGGWYGRYGYGYGYGSTYGAEFNVAVGIIANFHFYQLIADKVSKDIHADKLDVYAGLNLGSGVAIHPNSTNGNGDVAIDALAFGGPQVGARYYFTPKIAANLELGYGKTFVNGGITFKLGGGSSSTPKAKKK
jgi:hypothetical protein